MSTRTSTELSSGMAGQGEQQEPTARNVLLIHGRGFKPGGAAFSELCWEALASGITRDFPEQSEALGNVRCELAYYGDLSGALLTAAGKRYDEVLDIGDRRHALKSLKTLTTRKEFGIRHYDRLPGKTALYEFIADITAPVCSAFGMWVWLCKRCSRDFAAYLGTEPDYAEQVRDRLRKKLLPMLERGERILLISHGTGSVVAWDVLWELSHTSPYKEQLQGKKVDLWLTLGAPLGDAGVRRRLRGASEKTDARFPGNVVSWCNVSAEDDYTCHDKTIADDLRQMLQAKLLSSVTDFTIYNQAVRYGRSNPHSSVGYLIHPRVSKIVAGWLRDGVKGHSPM
ncbi:MAG TPA: hypothetical protein PKK10_13100 [Woeseiaceae bacterium]|nr:hypothetical protein [Woeseiaceae bacterium]